MNKAVFLDRDGTIIQDNGYACNVQSIRLMDDVADNLLRLQRAGYLLVVVTNQSGVARGYFTESQLQVFNDTLVATLRDYGINITAVYYCPHHPDGVVENYRVNCDCRKPKTGMFYQAVADWDIDLHSSYAIGDNVRDVAICKDSGCKGCLIGNFDKTNVDGNVQVFDSFNSAVNEILKEQQ